MSLDHDDPRLLPISLRPDLLARGHTDRTLTAAVRRGTLARPRRGAYVDGPAWAGLDPVGRFAVRSRAALSQSRAPASLSHTSALTMHDAPVWGLDLGDAHLTRHDGKTGRREAGVCQHRGAIDPADVVSVHGVDVTAPARAVLEVGTIARAEQTLVVANHFLHRRQVTLEELVDRYGAATERWPGSQATRVALRLADRRVASVGESRLSYFLWWHRYPTPIPQFRVYDGDVLVAELDFAIPELGIWLEFDGREKYQRYLRPGEDVTDFVVREKGREDLVAELTGWRCFRVTWPHLAEPVKLDLRLQAFIDRVLRSRRAG
ncbi:hypothetical protein [Nocardioides sp. YIM 152588]|uniref:hypothetical protein n=1 Tax=Nocardioides sp. YIM 152588 TaxID=3158259 RepID=UPI0032E4FD8E